MIYIIAALYHEAQPLIQYYHLTRSPDGAPFVVFQNEKEGIRLVITGTGNIAAASSVAGVCAGYQAGRSDFLLNIGICAKVCAMNEAAQEPDEVGEIFLCNKLTEQMSGRTYYPDVLYRHPFREAQLVTGTTVWSGNQCVEQTVLYDMEAAAVYQAGIYFLGANRMSFLKIVSDKGEPSEVSPEQIEELVNRNLGQIAGYIGQLQRIFKEEQRISENFDEDTGGRLEQLCEDLHCSKVMRDTVFQYFCYYRLAGTDANALIDDFYRTGQLPCRDKREGKLRLQELKEKVLSGESAAGNCSESGERADWYQPAFSHIYVEQEVWTHPRTKALLAKFPQAKVVPIAHYKDVFCRKHQNVSQQHQAQKLILAAKHGNLVYEGAPVCQSFGNEYFYYCSCVMNCIFDCEYCYLKGMYPSGNLVVFVNPEDIFAEVERLLAQHPVYLCVSYDTDLLALEAMIGYTDLWTGFVAKHENLTIEIRTKSARMDFWRHQVPVSRVVYAFTISPQAVIEKYERGTPGLAQRIACANAALDAGFAVRLCFDPMIYCQDWRQQYDAMLRQIFDGIDVERLVDVSVGSFRISQDYLKQMRRQAPDSAVVQFPYENDGGVYQYPKKLLVQMEEYLVGKLLERIPREKIFLWEK